jgi:AraC-like DNA-binding protein
MDILSKVLGQAGLQRRILETSAFTPGLALRFPCVRSMGLHAVLQGSVTVFSPALDQPITLQAGDLLWMARGTDHVLAAGAVRSLRGIRVEFATLAEPAVGPVAAHAPDAPLVFGAAFQFWHEPVHPLLRELPVLHRISAQALGPLTTVSMLLGLIRQELAARDPASMTITSGLTDALFGSVLRMVVAQLGREGLPSWPQAVKDPAIARVLECMHAQPHVEWTLDRLAQQAFISRTALAERFRMLLGITPLNYLRSLRMQKAQSLLCDTDRSLEAIAQMVGYQDAFSFSKVFKRVVGSSPKAFRTRDAQEREAFGRMRA